VLVAVLATPWWSGLQLSQWSHALWKPLAPLVLDASQTDQSRLRVGAVRSATISQPGLFASTRGLEHGFAERFASFSGRALEVKHFATSAEVRAALRAKEIDVAAVGFTSDAGPDTTSVAVKPTENPWIIAYAPGYAKPKGDADLRGATVVVLPRIAASTMYAEVKARFTDTRFQIFPYDDEEALLAEVDSANIKLALIDANALEAMQHVYYAVGRGFTVHQTERAWLVRAQDASLLSHITHFAQTVQEDRSLYALRDQYFGHTLAVNSFDAITFEQRISEVLPQWRSKLKAAQDDNNIDWRLLAALAYQESQWQPKAVSYTGVWGFMQLTQDTANMYRVDRTNPDAAIAAGARHLAYLHRATPERIPEPDRSYMALAAYNIGLGHVDDARVLAQRAKTNPDRWVDVKAQLPKLADPKVAATLKFGSARGYEAVDYVDRIRAFYDIIARHEGTHNGRTKPKAKTLPPGTQEAKREQTPVQTAMLLTSSK
jgi:membrane-bound lytic murein transglycosylase F